MLLVGSRSYADYKYHLSICALFQNEAPYLKEWIEYHKLLGVDHFYLFNHYSKDDYLTVLEPYIRDGSVELKDELTVTEDIKTFYPMQCKCYTHCAAYASGLSKWVAFIDIDEFLVPIQDESLTTFLKRYEEFGGIGVNWLIFGTSNQKKIPEDKLLIETLTSCTEKSYVDNRYVKCIGRPERILRFDNAHFATFKKGYLGVNTDKFPIEGPMSDVVVINKLRINHYWTRDEDFFYRVKKPRQEKWLGKKNPVSPQMIFNKMNARKDELILRYVPSLKKVIIK